MATLAYRTAGSGPALLLIHGGAEDAAMLEPQALAFAERGRRVAWYDRRGTGATPRDDWPAGGVRQHAADAAAIVEDLGGHAQVLGFSSGGVIALELAASWPALDIEVIAWEPAVITALDGGAELHAQLVAPINDYLAGHPEDWRGAFALQLAIISDGQADLDSPEVAAQMVNAEAAVRDDGPVITRHEFAPGALPASRIRLARSAGTSALHAAVIDGLVAAHGLRVEMVEGAADHEVYLSAPEVLAGHDWTASVAAGAPAGPHQER